MTAGRPAVRAVVTALVRTAAVVAVSAVLLALPLVVAAPSAMAHESVESTSPASSARLDGGPTTVAVTLTGPLGDDAPVTLSVTDTQNRPVTAGAPTVSADRRTVSVAVAPGTVSGSYLVRFAGVTGDSHPIRTAFAFTVGDATAVTASGSVAGSDAADPGTVTLNETVTVLGYLGGWCQTAIWPKNCVIPSVKPQVRGLRLGQLSHNLAKNTSLLGLALAGGLVLLRTGGAPLTSAARAAVLGGCLLTAATAVVAVAVHGPLVTGAGPGAALHPELLGSTLAVPHGRLLVLRAVAALVLAAAAAPMLRAQMPGAPMPGPRRDAPAPAPARPGRTSRWSRGSWCS